MMLERILTGVEGLDTMLRGGLIRERTYLVKGGPGAGKTILSMQFLIEGAKRREKVAYVTLEEPEDDVRKNMRSLGFDISKIKIVDLSPTSDHPIFMSLINGEIDVKTFDLIIKDLIGNVDRLVVDPITMLRIASNSEYDYRTSLLRLNRTFKGLKATTVLTCNMVSDVEDSLVSGIIELHMIDVGGRCVRGLKIVKMKGSDFDHTMRPYRITEGGFEVYPDLNVFDV